MKYDKIVAMNQEKSRRNVAIVKKEIHNMLERREQITITALAKSTGFDRSFFYRNLEARKVVVKAISCQKTYYNPDQVIINQNLKEKTFDLQLENIKLKSEVEKLRTMNQQLNREIESYRMEENE